MSSEKRRYYYEKRLKEKPLINIWESMIQRCYNKNNTNYNNYGNRGIKVCDRWLNSYENFENDMGERPDKYTLDRIDVNGNYEPDNCRWENCSNQLKNRRAFSNTNYKYIYHKKRDGREFYRILIKDLKIDTTRTTLEKAIQLVNEVINDN